MINKGIDDRSTVDMLLLSLPWWDMLHIPCAPPVLKGIADSHRYNIKTLDCNSILKHNFCNNSQEKLFQLETYFCFESQSSSKLVDDFYKNIIDIVIDTINKNNVRYVALSVFSVYTQKATLELVQQLKPKINVPIVAGGRGLSTKSNISIHHLLTAAEKMINFANILRKKKLVDYVIEGDGEDAIVDLLDENFDQSTIKKFTAKNNSLEYPFSNFDDFQLEDYKWYGNIQLPVISSKGCVRSCDFCDVGSQMAKFQSKNGQRLAEEMIHLSNQYHINEFVFADSIVNGNMKELKNTINFLVNYNNSMPDKSKIFWNGQWICRPRNTLKPEFFDLLKQSGCKHVTIGAEHGSDRVLSAMNKKTDVDGFFYEVEQIHRVGMQCGYNTIVGHWAELFEDFEKLIEMWISTGPYIANRSITSVYLSMFGALDNTPATTNTDVNQLVKSDDNFTLLSYSNLNPTLTLKTKLIRYLILLEIATKLNMPVANIVNKLKAVENYLSNNDQITKVNNFFKNNVALSSNFQCKKTIDFFNNVQHCLDNKILKMYPTVEISLTMIASVVNDDPQLQIIHNNSVVYNQKINEGTHKIKLNLSNDFKNTNFLKFSLINKNHNDTIVDQFGNIVKDKFIKFESIIIDKVDLLRTDIDFYYKLNSSPGLYKPGEDIVIKYQAPFWKYFIKNTPNYEEWHGKNNPDQISALVNLVKIQLNQLKY